MLKNKILSLLCHTLNLTNIITEPTCFKSYSPTLIDVIMLVTKCRKFIKGFSLDTGINDFHNLIGGILRQYAPIPRQKTITYRKLASIDYDKVNDELMYMNLDAMIQNKINLNDKYEVLQNTVINILDRHAPKKQKTIKITDFHCMTKRFRKAILIRNQFRNKFFTHRSLHFQAMYRKHRNNVTLIKK